VLPQRAAGYEVEAVIGERVRGGRRQFHIMWRGSVRAMSTWEDEANVNCPELVAAFRATRERFKAPHDFEPLWDSGKLAIEHMPAHAGPERTPPIVILSIISAARPFVYSVMIDGKCEQVDETFLRTRYPLELTRFLADYVLERY
jgi:hypothetical protein